MILRLLLLLTFASWVYWLVALRLMHDFMEPSADPAKAFTPPVSVLKPVKGVDFEAYVNFASFCEQDYPEYELLFGVADPDDPVIPIIRRLQHDYPGREIRLIVVPAEGANRKASLLHHLSEQARYDYLVASDSDMRVGPDYLRRTIAPLADLSVGLVTSPYRGQSPLTLTAKLEALYMSATFMPSAVVGLHVPGMGFALGASVALRRRDLERIGGYAALTDYLADDYQIGARIAALGLRVHLSNYIVSCVLGSTSFKEQWDREVRWARCTRVSRPIEYPGLWLTFSTPLAVLYAIAAGLDHTWFVVLAASLLLRWLVGWGIAMYTADRELPRLLIWLPVRDMLSALVWFNGLIGQHVVWRGETYAVLPGGKLRPVADTLAEPAKHGAGGRP